MRCRRDRGGRAGTPTDRRRDDDARHRDAGSRRSHTSGPRWRAARMSSPPTRVRPHSRIGRWRAAAKSAERRFLFEGAVMDGIPIFNLVRETLPAVRIDGFRGVVNSTTNYILTAMEQGEAFEPALARMQAAGIAEADASLDVDGWDAAAKTAALANVLLGASLTPHAVARRGISQATGRQAMAARATGRRIKLVAEAHREGRRVVASVGTAGIAGRRSTGGRRGPAECDHSEDRPARGHRHRAARRRPDPDRLCAALGPGDNRPGCRAPSS